MWYYLRELLMTVLQAITRNLVKFGIADTVSEAPTDSPKKSAATTSTKGDEDKTTTEQATPAVAQRRDSGEGKDA